jgi:CBS domain-containing protein
MKQLPVIEAKRFGVLTCRPDETLVAAARRMADHTISALVVVNADGVLLGLLSRTDLVAACYQWDDWADHTVEEVMSREVVTVFPDEPLGRVMELLLDRHIHRVVIVEPRLHYRPADGPRPLGVISAADLLYHMLRTP